MTDIRLTVARAIMSARHGRRGSAAITAFLEAAAEKGWRMMPDDATEEMQAMYLFGSTARSAWRFFCKAAPPFEWDKE